jgi:glycosyltransferase involved in cell wall biosynthesis
MVLQRLAIHLSERVILISDGNLAEIERFLPRKKAYVVYNYVTTENNRPFSPSPLNSELAIIGRFQDLHKQQFTFLREQGDFVKRNGLIVHFFGTGSDERAMRQYVDSNHLDHNFRFHGWQEEEQIYSESFSFVLNLSRWEGMPLSLLEAIYHDRIVLASDIRGNRELVDRAFLFRNSAELRYLLTSLVRDRHVNMSIVAAQKQRLFARCNKKLALASFERMLMSMTIEI